MLTFLRRLRGGPRPDAAPDSSDAELAGLREAAEQRRLLIDACIGIADHARHVNEALWERARQGLTRAGVAVVIPDGEPFDPDVHMSLRPEWTKDPALAGLVYSTIRVGYRDGQVWLRRPEVSVYRLEEPGRG